MEVFARVAILIVAVLFGSLLPEVQSQSIAIAFKYVNEYSFIWDDSGSGASRDVSIWKQVAVDIGSGFSPLGDTASPSHDKPDIPSLTVSALVDGALARPTGFTEVWNDRGSGASDDVRILRMDPPSGYTCLGYVAVQGYKNLPDANQYWCVKSEYVVYSGTYDLIWNDVGSAADSDVSLWANTNINSADGIDATTFTVFATHYTQTCQPNLLNGTVAKHSALIPSTTTDKLAIIVYQVTDTERIWDDSGSGADAGFSSWRATEPNGYFSLGDIGVASPSAPHFSILARARKADALAAPVSFRQRWNNAGSGADTDVAFYEPVCPAGYRVLGYVTVASHSTLPSTNDIRCVKAEYTVEGGWEFVWTDARSGADVDVTVWKAINTSGSGQGVEAMSARPCRCDMDRIPYILDTDFIQYIDSRPVNRYILKSVSYRLDNGLILSQEPEVLARTTLINQGTTSQIFLRRFTYSYQEMRSWSTTLGLEIGISTIVTASVPMLSSQSIIMSGTSSFFYTTGESASATTIDCIRAGVEVLPLSSKSATVTANRYVLDVPYTATVTPVFTDGTTGSPYSFTGVYEGVQVNNIQVIFGADVPLPRTNGTEPTMGTDGSVPDTTHLLMFSISVVVVIALIN